MLQELNQATHRYENWNNNNKRGKISSHAEGGCPSLVGKRAQNVQSCSNICTCWILWPLLSMNIIPRTLIQSAHMVPNPSLHFTSPAAALIEPPANPINPFYRKTSLPRISIYFILNVFFLLFSHFGTKGKKMCCLNSVTGLLWERAM